MLILNTFYWNEKYDTKLISTSSARKNLYEINFHSFGKSKLN